MTHHTRRLRTGRDTLRAYLQAGSTKKAAKTLGVTESTVRQRLSAYYTALGVANAAQAAYVLDRPDDWTPKAPDGVV